MEKSENKKKSEQPDDKQFELEKQLHEQYAINNNSNLASIIALITAMLGVIAVYGFVFIHTTLEFAQDWGSFLPNDNTYTMDVLLFAAIASYFILVVVFYLSAYLGTNQRKEQFITHAIRKKYYDYETYNSIFPRNYNPYNKTKCDFIQGLYGEICCIIKLLFWIITVMTFIKIGFNVYKYHDYGCAHCSSMIIANIFFILIILSLISFCCIIERFYDSYKKREQEFFEKNWGKEYSNRKEPEHNKNCCIRKFFCCN